MKDKSRQRNEQHQRKMQYLFPNLSQIHSFFCALQIIFFFWQIYSHFCGQSTVCKTHWSCIENGHQPWDRKPQFCLLWSLKTHGSFFKIWHKPKASLLAVSKEEQLGDEGTTVADNSLILSWIIAFCFHKIYCPSSYIPLHTSFSSVPNTVGTGCPIALSLAVLDFLGSVLTRLFGVEVGKKDIFQHTRSHG